LTVGHVFFDPADRPVAAHIGERHAVPVEVLPAVALDLLGREHGQNFGVQRNGVVDQHGAFGVPGQGAQRHVDAVGDEERHALRSFGRDPFDFHADACGQSLGNLDVETFPFTRALRTLMLGKFGLMPMRILPSARMSSRLRAWTVVTVAAAIARPAMLVSRVLLSM
jgi:hypothetical protein